MKWSELEAKMSPELTWPVLALPLPTSPGIETSMNIDLTSSDVSQPRDTCHTLKQYALLHCGIIRILIFQDAAASVAVSYPRQLGVGSEKLTASSFHSACFRLMICLEHT